MENVRHLYRKGNNTAVTRTYICEDCGKKGSNRGKSRITNKLYLDEDGVWRHHHYCLVCQPKHSNSECFQAALNEMISEQISPGTPQCKKCGSWNTAHYIGFKWQCQVCKNVTPGRGFKQGDPHIRELTA